VADVFLTVAIMSVAFLTEIALSSWLEWSEGIARSAQRAADAKL
jgi:hypothetical protein